MYIFQKACFLCILDQHHQSFKHLWFDCREMFPCMWCLDHNILWLQYLCRRLCLPCQLHPCIKHLGQEFWMLSLHLIIIQSEIYSQLTILDLPQFSLLIKPWEEEAMDIERILHCIVIKLLTPSNVVIQLIIQSLLLQDHQVFVLKVRYSK